MKKKSGAKVAIYPGSFDPPTYGHLDIIERASSLFDKVVVTVAGNMDKKALFRMEERVDILRRCTRRLKNVAVDAFEGLLVDYLSEKGCRIIVKGLRAVTDFEYEFQMALANKSLDSKVETVFLVSQAHHSFLSSSIVKEVAALNGNVSLMVPEYVARKLKEKLK